MNCRSTKAARTTTMRIPNRITVGMLYFDLDNILNLGLTRAADPTSVVIERMQLTLALREQIAKGDIEETIEHCKVRGWLYIGSDDTFRVTEQGMREWKR